MIEFLTAFSFYLFAALAGLVLLGCALIMFGQWQLKRRDGVERAEWASANPGAPFRRKGPSDWWGIPPPRGQIVWSRFPPRCRECSQNHYPDAGCDPRGD